MNTYNIPSVGSKYAAFVIKPDAMSMFLDGPIIKDLEDAGMRILFRKEINITGEDIVRLYPDHSKTTEYPSIVKLYGAGTSLLLIVEDEKASEHPDIFQRVKEVKGKARMGGIRDKYLLGRKEDFEAVGLTDGALMDELAKNRIHATDDQTEMNLLIDMYISPDDIRRIREYNQALARELDNRFRLVSISQERER